MDQFVIDHRRRVTGFYFFTGAGPRVAKTGPGVLPPDRSLRDRLKRAPGNKPPVLCNGEREKEKDLPVNEKPDPAAPHPDIVPGNAPGELLPP
jgi:hypothetical protein